MDFDLRIEKTELDSFFSLNYINSDKSNLVDFMLDLINNYGSGFKKEFSKKFYVIADKNYKDKINDLKIFELSLILNDNELFNSLKRDYITNDLYSEVFSVFNLDLQLLLNNKLSAHFLENLQFDNLIKSYLKADDYCKEKKYNPKDLSYGKEISKFCSEYNFSFVWYSSNHVVSFGKMKGKTVQEILEIRPSLIIFYVKKLKHFLLKHDCLVNPFLINFLKDDKSNRNFAKEGYNTFYEYFPDNFDESYD